MGRGNRRLHEACAQGNGKGQERASCPHCSPGPRAATRSDGGRAASGARIAEAEPLRSCGSNGRPRVVDSLLRLRACAGGERDRPDRMAVSCGAAARRPGPPPRHPLHPGLPPPPPPVRVVRGDGLGMAEDENRCSHHSEAHPRRTKKDEFGVDLCGISS